MSFLKRDIIYSRSLGPVKSVSVRSVCLTESWRKRINNAREKLFHCWCPLYGRVCLQGCWLRKCWRLISNFFQSVLSIWVQRNVLTQILRCQVKLSGFLYIYSFSKDQYLLQKCKAKVGKMLFIYVIKMKGELLSRKLRGL